MKRIQTTKADETPEFVEFWEGPLKEDGSRDRLLGWISIMHKNDGRGDARDVFFQHVRFLGADPQDIADGAKWYIRNRDDWKLHASTWINRRAYEDGAEMYRNYKSRQREAMAKLREQEIERAQNVAAMPSRPGSRVAQIRAKNEQWGATPFLRAFNKQKAGGE